MPRSLPAFRPWLACAAVGAGVLAAGEMVHWVASHCLFGGGAAPVSGGGEAVVVLGHADAGHVASRRNRSRVRAGLRSRSAPDSLLVLSGGPVAGAVPEAELMARYAIVDCGYSGPLALESTSRSTWENIAAVTPMIEDAARIIIVSDPVHGLKARLFLHRQRPDLAARLARAQDYRVGEDLMRKPATALLGLIDLALSVWVPGWAQNSATGLAGVRRLLAGGRQPSVFMKRPKRSSPSVISSGEAA
ncbi:YdcF family protein [Actinomyces sp. MRS3W]|uniref:YdcF family protein n=1 Tax=Actinomyces sp. MRS3W TaxID=2800796 RepID=UPI0028FD5FC7|nr:YdcF family protein [Actinomyces sp. MRS3W]MDU0348132.1 YdcF family protein [Actinomyces sp. MRS3W]